MQTPRETPWWVHLSGILDEPPGTYLADIADRTDRLMAARRERDVTIDHAALDAWCEDQARRDPFAGEGE